MDTPILLDTVSTLLADLPELQTLLDLLWKSSLVIGATYLIAQVFRRQLTNNAAHLLWLHCMLCVALIPLAMVLAASFHAEFLYSGPVSVITINAAAASSAQTTPQSGLFILRLIYCLVALLLLARLMFSALSLRRINSAASYCANQAILCQLEGLLKTLEISRPVTVKFSDSVASPMSFGLVKPVVVLPLVAAQWSESTIEDVLVHELSHIKRLDWLTMLFCHVLCGLFWINPLVWFAKSRVDAAAEQACDAAVLRCGKDGIKYAEDLLRLARESLSNKQAPVLAQLMFDTGSLSLRVKNILDGGLIGKVSKKFIGALAMGGVLVLGACSGINLFGSSDLDREILPTKAEPPQYPTVAAQEGIEGWVLVEFTVTKEGLVAENSVKIVDAEPAQIFDRTATRAAERFEFEPPSRAGKVVDIEGVQYLFRFNLEPGGFQPGDQRPPPLARSRAN